MRIGRRIRGVDNSNRRRAIACMLRRMNHTPGDRPEAHSVAELLRMGASYGVVRGARLRHPFHGVRSAGEPDPLFDALPLLRGGDRYSHSSAARVWGAPLPSDATRAVHITAAPGNTPHRRGGVIGHRSHTSAIPVVVDGMPVSDVATMFLELATELSPEWLVAVGDFLILDPRYPDPSGRRPVATIASLAAALDRLGTRGRRAALRALARLRLGVESPMETLLRLLLVDAGLPEPRCGQQVVDRAGVPIGWFDLVWPDFRTIAEYDGDQHRTDDLQYDRDITRFDRASEAGWRVVRVRKRGVQAERAVTISRVDAALRAGGWRG